MHNKIGTVLKNAKINAKKQGEKKAILSFYF